MRSEGLVGSEVGRTRSDIEEVYEYDTVLELLIECHSEIVTKLIIQSVYRLCIGSPACIENEHTSTTIT